MTNLRTFAVASLALAGGLGITAWVLDPFDDGVRVVGERPQILVAGADGGLDAAYFGRVVWLPEANCFVGRAPEETSTDPAGNWGRTPIVWPPGSRPTTVDGVAAVRVPGFGLVRSGDRVDSAGGVHSREGAWADLPLLSDACFGPDGSKEYAFLERISAATPVTP